MPNTFLAAGEKGTCLLSSDGKTWKEVHTGKDGEVFNSSCVGGGHAVTSARYGGQNTFAASADGATWSDSKFDAKYSKYIRGMFYFNAHFHAIGGNDGGGDSKSYVIKSTDGETWSEPHDIAGKHLMRRYAVGDGKVVGVGDYGRRSVSSDGLEWEDTPDAKPVDTCIDVAFGNGVFAGGGLHGMCMSSRDGLTWEHRQVGEEGEHINAMLWDGMRFVGVGLGATYTSPDGITWQRTPNTHAPTRAVFGNGIFVGSRYRGRLLISSDAITWEETTRVVPNMETLTYGRIGIS
ncbi:MAG: hypothetical protein ACI9TH_003657 [Kiritimatiellia bacterium]|jgi:hypothetical protein